ncbi:MAG: sigma factor [Chthoniobacteraceae bacterium]
MMTASKNPDSPAPQPSLLVSTRWSVVLAAWRAESPESGAALETLCRGYWYPLDAFVRRSGHSAHDAQDLTQEFFARLLQKHWPDAAERERGKFRTFLIMAMKRFLANEWDRARAAKRGGGVACVPLDAESAEARSEREPAAAAGADVLYERRWALTVLDTAMAALRVEYEADGRGDDFTRLKEFLTAERSAIPYDEIARQAGGSEGAAARCRHGAER